MTGVIPFDDEGSDVKITKHPIFQLIGVMICLFIASCSLNEPFYPECKGCNKKINSNGEISRIVNACDSKDCSNEYIIKDDDDYYLTFIEFTDRGNLYSRDRLYNVLRLIEEEAKEDNGVNVVVYVHGWRHNAHHNDTNLSQFKGVLERANKLGSKRKLIGVYVGWRGDIFPGDFFDFASYWDRDKVSLDIGKGGVTELLLRLEKILKAGNDDGKQTNLNKNQLLVTGHSMGASILLASLNEIFLERIIEQDQVLASDHVSFEKPKCIITEPFAHGVVLLNPAIEANEILQLKELVASTDFCTGQDRFMHILSSTADTAATLIFGYAQYGSGFLIDSHKKLPRDLGSTGNIELKEADLATITIGNYAPFWTGILSSEEEFVDNSNQISKSPEIKDNTGGNRQKTKKWSYQKLSGMENIHVLPDEIEKQHVKVKPNDPLAFIITDDGFISDHNDVFNDNVSSYLLAIMAEARYARALQSLRPDIAAEGPCICRLHRGEDGNCNGDVEISSKKFDFGLCFQAYEEIWKEKKVENIRNITP